MRKLLAILVLIPVLYLIALPAWFASSVNLKQCTGLDIHIRDSADYHFVTNSHLRNIVYSSAGRVEGKPVRDINTSFIEDKIRELRELKTVEVFFTIDGILHVYADQRDPLMRIMPDEGGDFFMDDEGFLFRRRNLYNPRLHIVQGNITITPAMLDSVSVLDTLIKRSILKDTFRFVQYIKNDSFWSAQIDQIVIDKKNEVVLIPRVGNHIVQMGPYDNFETKLRNLGAFYEKVMPETGWNRYSVINLKYKDQIVCRRRL
jgi:cell division protein FtsQ